MHASHARTTRGESERLDTRATSSLDEGSTSWESTATEEGLEDVFWVDVSSSHTSTTFQAFGSVHVVDLPLILVTQDGKGFSHSLESLFCTSRLAFVRVQPQSQLSVRLFDLVITGPFFDAKDLVVIVTTFRYSFNHFLSLSHPFWLLMPGTSKLYIVREL